MVLPQTQGGGVQNNGYFSLTFESRSISLLKRAPTALL
jgi:hypothetical protein